MSSLVTLGIVHAYLEREGLSNKLYNGVYDGNVILNIDQNGFSRISTYTNIESMWLSFEKVPRSILTVKRRVLEALPRDCSQYYQDIEYFFDDIYNYECYIYDRAQQDIFGIYYSKEKGKLFLYDCIFEPNFNTMKVNYRLMKIEVSMGLPGNFFIGINAKGNIMGISIKQKLEKIEGSLTQRHIVDSIIIALAPGLLGLVSLPQDFLNRITVIANAPIQG